MSATSASKAQSALPTVQDFYIPPSWFDDDEDNDHVLDRLKVTFTGRALRQIIRGSRILGLPFADFVRIAVKQKAYLAEKQLEGYQLVLRDSHGSYHPLPPSV